MLAVDEAERRGDAGAALDLIEAKLNGPDGEMLWRPERVTRLVQLATFGPWLPRWATSRWIIEQAVQELAPHRDPAIDRAFEAVVEVRGSLEDVPRPAGEDPRIKVMETDWVYRQSVLYDFGTLASYLRRAPADLVAGADQIASWAATPMNGFRFVQRSPGSTTWTDLATDRQIEIPNIGSAALIVPGEHAIGRLVPIEDGQMFETRPLQVPEPCARAVAARPSDWISILASARESGERITTGGIPFGFLSDVPPEISALTLYDDLGLLNRYDARASTFLDAVGRAFRDQATDDPEAVDVWACVAAELLNWNLFRQLSITASADQADVYSRLGQTLSEPAAQFCRDLAAAARKAA